MESDGAGFSFECDEVSLLSCFISSKDLEKRAREQTGRCYHMLKACQKGKKNSNQCIRDLKHPLIS